MQADFVAKISGEVDRLIVQAVNNTVQKSG
jgi:hypothetical protein